MRSSKRLDIRAGLCFRYSSYYLSRKPGHPSTEPADIHIKQVLPQDDALLRRLIVLRFTYGEKPGPEKVARFEKEIIPRLGELRVLGEFIAHTVMDSQKLLEMEWESLAVELLKRAYQYAGLDTPSWLALGPQQPGDVYEDMREMIRNHLVRRINEEYSRFVGRVVVEIPERGDSVEYPRTALSFGERVRVVLENNLLPWAVLREGMVIFTTGLANELREVIGDIGGLKSIAELLGWEYKKSKIGDKSIWTAVAELEKIIELLTPNITQGKFILAQKQGSALSMLLELCTGKCVR